MSCRQVQVVLHPISYLYLRTFFAVPGPKLAAAYVTPINSSQARSFM